MPKIADMPGVINHGSSEPVELWRDDETGRLVIRAYNEGGYNCTDVDLWGLLDWLSSGQGRALADLRDSGPE